MHADSSRLHRVRKLFVSGDSTDILFTTLEGLGAELSNRWMAIGNDQGLGKAMRENVARTKALSEAIAYASERLTEVLARQQLIGWMKSVLAYETNPDIFAQASDPKAQSWRLYMGLAIKDFHVAIGSLMDALAPVVIQVKSELKLEDRVKLSGWAYIQQGPKRTYREKLPNDLRDIVDSADRWWIAIKKVRNLLTHRKHHRIIFGNSEDGLLFQVYDQSRFPEIQLPAVLYREGNNVVDFDLYSAFVLAEVLTLFDDLGNAIAPKMHIAANNVSQMYLRVVNKSLAQSIEHLIHVAG